MYYNICTSVVHSSGADVMLTLNVCFQVKCSLEKRTAWRMTLRERRSHSQVRCTYQEVKSAASMRLTAVKSIYSLCIFALASVVGADGSSAAQVDIITEQPRSSQHTLQPGESTDLSASSEQGGGGGTSASDTPESPNDNEEEMLSRSSSGGANVTPETADYTTPETEAVPLGDGGPLLSTNDRSLPPSDSSQTTTEGPDSAVTPSDVAELVSVTGHAREI